ncbi:MAG: TetR/AcrR family transcriptional regulator [Deltaproteobacteria bacterium]|nr:TetR/AcrR family transcriptional regulator [Kofleriaceae bacterium]
MPQILKDEVRARILDAALAVFATDGFERATMAAIALRAGIGTASIYRYYPGKDELFAAVITPELAARFASLLERRVSALARRTLRGDANDDLGGDMLRFWIEHRLAVVILLDRAAGTPHAAYGARFVAQLVKHTLAELRAAHPGLRIRPGERFVLTTVFDNTRRLLAAVLAQHADPAELRAAIEAFWSYQIAGIRALADHLARRS